MMRYGRGGWEPVLNKMLMPVITGVEDLVIGAGAEAANRAWCDAVVLPFAEILADRYPFRLDGLNASIAEVEEFFRPKSGTIWVHYEDKLKGDIEMIGRRFRLASKPAIDYRSSLLTFLAKANDLTELLFPRGSEKIAPQIKVRLKSATGDGGTATRVVLRVGTNPPLEYGNWQEKWESLSWPGSGARLDVIGSMRGLPKTIQPKEGGGDWDLFRMLDMALRQLGRDQDEYMRAEWRIPAARINARLDFRPADLVDALHNFSIPRTIAPGSSPCAQ
jgi:type VI protein secretion system component VasK